MKEALKLAVEAMENMSEIRYALREKGYPLTDADKRMRIAITVAKEALAQPERKFDPNDSFERDEAAAARVREFMRNH